MKWLRQKVGLYFSEDGARRLLFSEDIGMWMDAPMNKKPGAAGYSFAELNGPYRRALTKATQERLQAAAEARQPYCPPVNADLKVTRQYPKDWTVEDIGANPDSFDIGKNDGRSPSEIVFLDFDDAAQMTNYEFAAYEILGEAELDRQGIDTLYDMFGTGFATRFYARKRELNATHSIQALLRERAEIDEQITQHKRVVDECVPLYCTLIETDVGYVYVEGEDEDDE